MESGSNTVSFVQRELEFVRFLLVCNKQQGALLLKSLTKPQTNAISEIFYNILFSQSLDEKLLEDLKRHKTLIRRIGDRQSALNNRRRAISLHSGVVFKILLLVEGILPDVVRDV